MRSLILTSVLALAFSTVAQPTEGFDTLSSPPDQARYAVGDNLPKAWDPETLTDSITLTLIGGPTKNLLNPIIIIAPTLANQLSNYNWTIPTDIGTYASYGVNLTDNTNTTLFQYSNQFYITGGEAVGTDTLSTSLPPSTTSTGTTSADTSVNMMTPSASTTSSSGTTSSPSTTSTTKTTETTSSSASAGPASTSGKAAAATGKVLSGGFAVLGGLALALAL